MAKGKPTTKRRGRPQPAINLDQAERHEMAQRAWRERKVAIFLPGQVHGRDLREVCRIASRLYDDPARRLDPVDQVKVACDVIEEVSAKLDSTIRFCAVMGDRLTAHDEAPIYYTILNLLEPLHNMVQTAVSQIYADRYPDKKLEG